MDIREADITDGLGRIREGGGGGIFSEAFLGGWRVQVARHPPPGTAQQRRTQQKQQRQPHRPRARIAARLQFKFSLAAGRRGAPLLQARQRAENCAKEDREEGVDLR